MKILPAGAELFHADGQKDIVKLLIVFRNFANSPTNDRTRYDIVNVQKVSCCCYTVIAVWELSYGTKHCQQLFDGLSCSFRETGLGISSPKVS